ncbi:hypothetical protein HMPREF1547_01826 [Blautia sp. KLE 1732]|nr:hypothetical protein HMPREF1547_01826 [Blautia sp. KLE 1732]
MLRKTFRFLLRLSYRIRSSFSSKIIGQNHFSYFLQLFRLVFVYFFVSGFVKRFIFINFMYNTLVFSDTLCVKNALCVEAFSFS